MKKTTTVLLILSTLMSFNVYAEQDSAAFQALLEKEWSFRLQEFAGLARNQDVPGSNAKMTHVSEEDQLRRYNFWKQIQAEQAEISCDKLSREECINYRMFGRQMHSFMASYESKDYLMPFNSDWGFYLGWAQWGDSSDFHSEQEHSERAEDLEGGGQEAEGYKCQRCQRAGFSR